MARPKKPPVKVASTRVPETLYNDFEKACIDNDISISAALHKPVVKFMESYLKRNGAK